MPSSYAVMNEEEMEYLTGGAEVYLNIRMYSKDYCLKIASRYTDATGLSQKRIAKEIYAHAILFLGGHVAKIMPQVKKIPGYKAIISYIISHSNPVNIGGDSWGRVAVYNAIWYAMPGTK